MSMLRKLHKQEVERFSSGEQATVVQAAAEPAAVQGGSLLDEFESMLLGKSEPAAAPAEVSPAPAGQVVIEAQDAPPAAPAPKPELTVEPKADEGSRAEAPSAALVPGFAEVLKGLAPVFKAATIYPGHDADPARVAEAVRRMSLVSTGLARISHRKRCTGPSDARKLLCKERFSATTESGPMQTQCNPKQYTFSGVGRRAVVAGFDGGRVSSDG
ncbi:hypothetical protein ACV356_29125, partial [Pseudomonas aeruginosa]